MEKLNQSYKSLINKIEKLSNEKIEPKEFETRFEIIVEIQELQHKFQDLKAKVKTTPRQNRKQQIYDLLKENIYSTSEISEKLNITRRNVSSIICALRKMNYNIKTTNINKESYLELIQD